VHWLNSVLAASGNDHTVVEIVIGVCTSLKLPWWIAAMRAAITNDDAKAERARKAMEAIKPHWHWLWQRRG
jgi:hypothetical protein